MCLTLGTFESVKAAHSKKPKIAKEDIVVYKVLTRHRIISYMFTSGYKTNTRYFSPYTRYFSPYRATPYTQDTLVSTPNFTKRTEYFYVDGEKQKKVQCDIYQGIHAYTTKPAAIEKILNFNRVCIKMIIPKGTKYYISSNGKEIVSLALKTPKIFRKEIL